MEEILEALGAYLAKLDEARRRGNATEHTYRPHLQTLIETLEPGLAAVNEPKQIACGAPDFIFQRRAIPIGYAEAKDIGGLAAPTKSDKDQRTRYLRDLENIFFTDYLEFVFYRKDADPESPATEYARIRVGEESGKGVKPLPEHFGPFAGLLRDFCARRGATIKTPEHLAALMADKARVLADVVGRALAGDEAAGEDSSLRGQLEAFRKFLIHDVTPEAFADVYAQTIAYGMFAARLHDESLETFSRREAAELIPKTNPLLRSLFGYIAGPDIDDRIRWVVDALAEVFSYTDARRLMDKYGGEPVIHFYETFLARYDERLRKARGVWYTPRPVVRFIARAADDLLQKEFGLADGLADTAKTKIKVKNEKGKLVDKHTFRAQILDPAAGTGAFLAEVVRRARDRFEGQEGAWSGYVEKQLIPRLHGFELLMAPYAMAHLNLEMLLRETGYRPKDPRRFSIYLANTLEEAHPETYTLFARWLADEANQANAVKNEIPVMLVIGNPPYSGHSSNKGDWMDGLMQAYKIEPGGGKLKERNSKWLNDDYVKFIRYGEYHIEKTGAGLLTYINNHSFLDNPTFRGMRWRLLQTFDKIYILDLHGNAKKKETAPDGGPDQNVFDIQQGVSINLFVKTGAKKRKGALAEVFHADLWGKRADKYAFLDEHTIETTPWQKVTPAAPFFFFQPKDNELLEEYNQGFSVNEMFPVNSVGVVTSRDDFVIDSDREALIKRMNDFFILDEQELKQKYGLKENQKWTIKNTREKAKGFNHNNIIAYHYRPFDIQYLYYEPSILERSREKVMVHLLEKENHGLMVARQCTSDWRYILATNLISDLNLTGTAGRFGSGYVCPLYLYPESDTLYENESRRPNLAPALIKELEAKTGLAFAPEAEAGGASHFAPLDVLDYIYGVLHAPAYRARYREFLRIDFPRVPWPGGAGQFRALAAVGAELRAFHLLAHAALAKPGVTFPEDGSGRVEKGFPDFRPDENGAEENPGETGRVYINETQYFGGAPAAAWAFYIGGYQPAQKWLKDRRGRALDYDDVRHYAQIVRALAETARLMREADKALLGE